MWWRTVVRLAGGLIALFGVGAMQNIQNSVDEMGILFYAEIDNQGALYFVSEQNPEAQLVVAMNTIQGTNGDKNYPLAVSPDSNTLTFISQDRAHQTDQLYFLNLSDGTLQEMTDSIRNIYGFWWSPDGSRIAYTTGTPAIDLGATILHIVDFDETTDFIDVNANEFSRLAFFNEVDWSLDSSQLVMSSWFKHTWQATNDPDTGWNITSVWIDEQAFENIVPTEIGGTEAHWGTDGVYFLCLPDEGRWKHLCKYDVETHELITLVDVSGLIDELQDVLQIDVLPNGKVALGTLTQTETLVYRVYVLNSTLDSAQLLHTISGPNSNFYMLGWAQRPPQLSEAGA